MSTIAEKAPEPETVIAPDPLAAIITRAAVPEAPVLTAAEAKLAGLAASGKFSSHGSARPSGFDWFSGWCGPGPCRDGQSTAEDGSPGPHRCRGMGENGAKVTPRYLACACTCHAENPRAVQIERDA